MYKIITLNGKMVKAKISSIHKINLHNRQILDKNMHDNTGILDKDKYLVGGDANVSCNMDGTISKIDKLLSNLSCKGSEGMHEKQCIGNHYIENILKTLSTYKCTQDGDELDITTKEIIEMDNGNGCPDTICPIKENTGVIDEFINIIDFFKNGSKIERKIGNGRYKKLVTYVLKHLAERDMSSNQNKYYLESSLHEIDTMSHFLLSTRNTCVSIYQLNYVGDTFENEIDKIKLLRENCILIIESIKEFINNENEETLESLERIRKQLILFKLI